MRRPFSAHVFLSRSIEGERQYLIFQRSPRVDLGLPAFFQGISGALEGQESFEEAAVREVFEETGIRINSLIYSGFCHRYPIKDEWRKHYGAEPKEERTEFLRWISRTWEIQSFQRNTHLGAGCI